MAEPNLEIALNKNAEEGKDSRTPSEYQKRENLQIPLGPFSLCRGVKYLDSLPVNDPVMIIFFSFAGKFTNELSFHGSLRLI
ncbi:MAG: hypothetical protein QXR87_05340 [Candidatus Hadarchaeales archaeon]